MRVPPDGIFVARVRLTAEERRQAQSAAIEKTPFIELADGQRREALEPVKVRLPPLEDALQPNTLAATLGFCMSENLQGNYIVEIREDADPTRTPLAIRATLQAYQAYNQAPFHMVLYIQDSDTRATDYITRQVVFAFPEDYVRRNEIKAEQPPPEVKFRLLPIPAEVPEPGEASGL